MPHLRILTNVDSDRFDDAFLKQLTKDMALINKKPESALQISVSGNNVMTMGGTSEPVAFVLYYSIGKIGEDYNTRYSNVLFEALNEKGIPQKRVYVDFHERQASDIAWDGKLVSQLI